MVESTAGQADEPVSVSVSAGVGQAADDDSLTNLQVKLNELGEMFYTYLGILQRDAPPRNANTSAQSKGSNNPSNAELLASIPEFAQDIVATSREIDAVIDTVEKDFSTVTTLDADIRAANAVSKKAGEVLLAEKNHANSLLADVRLVTAMRDDDESAN